MYGIIYNTFLFTATCYCWRDLLRDDNIKKILINVLNEYNNMYNVNFYGFVFMPNHIHLILSGSEDDLSYFKRSFTRISAHYILQYLSENDVSKLSKLEPTQKDRKHQIWERRPNWRGIHNENAMTQVLHYIHYNPLQSNWKITDAPDNYKFSSALSYTFRQPQFEFLTLWNNT